MKRLLVTCALVGLALASCGKDDNKSDVATEATTTTQGVASPTAPPTTLKTTTTAPKATPTTQTDTRVPASSQSPAAGTCGNSYNGVAEVVLHPDVPAPRCVIVKDSDFLRVENNFDVTVDVLDNAGGSMFELKPGQSDQGMKVIGGYFQPGVHRLKIVNAATKEVLYGGSGPEVWLKP